MKGNNIYDYLYRQLNPQTNNWNNIYSRYVVWFNLKTFLSYNNIPFKDYTKYDEDYAFLLEIQPSWLDIIDDQGIFDKNNCRSAERFIENETYTMG